MRRIVGGSLRWPAADNYNNLPASEQSIHMITPMPSACLILPLFKSLTHS